MYKLCAAVFAVMFAMREMPLGVLGLQVTMSQGGATNEHRSWAVQGEPREVALREPAAGISAAVSVNVAGRNICIFHVRCGPQGRCENMLYSHSLCTSLQERQLSALTIHGQSSSPRCMLGDMCSTAGAGTSHASRWLLMGFCDISWPAQRGPLCYFAAWTTEEAASLTAHQLLWGLLSADPVLLHSWTTEEARLKPHQLPWSCASLTAGAWWRATPGCVTAACWLASAQASPCAPYIL